MINENESPENNKEPLSSMQFRCDNCGSDMIYTPETNSLYCKTCNSTKKVEVKPFEIIENNLDETFKRLEDNKVEINKNSGLTEVECKSCGGKSIFNGNVFANKCVYCGSSMVATVENSSYIKPEYIIPFSVTKKEADLKIYDWIKGKFFMDSNFKRTLKNDGLYGVYVSYWTFDVNVDVEYNAMRCRSNNSISKPIDNELSLDLGVESQWLNAKGKFSQFYDDILVPGVSSQIPDIYNQTANFDTKNLVPYDEQYVVGFIAMKYDLDLESAWIVAKSQCSENIQRDVRRHIGGEQINNLEMIQNLSNMKFKQIVLPIWISGYTHKGKVYTFIVNGQNGTVSGTYPFNKYKVIFIGAIVTLIWIAFVIMIFTAI